MVVALLLHIAVILLAVPQAEQRLGTLSGTVVRLGTNDPIAEADVELTRIEGTAAYPLAPLVIPPGTFTPGALVRPTAPGIGDIFRLRTGAAGRFNFDGLKPGVYRLYWPPAGQYYVIFQAPRNCMLPR